MATKMHLLPETGVHKLKITGVEQSGTNFCSVFMSFTEPTSFWTDFLFILLIIWGC